MFIKKKLFPSPWDEPPPRNLKVKDYHYIHTKDDVLNSPYHSSAKTTQFYKPELPTFYTPPNPEVKPIAEISKVEGRERLKRRLISREQASTKQLKSLQCKSMTGSRRSLSPDLSKPAKSMIIDPLEDRTKTAVSFRQNSWNRLNALPKPSVQKVVNEFILKKDRGKF